MLPYPHLHLLIFNFGNLKFSLAPLRAKDIIDIFIVLILHTQIFNNLVGISNFFLALSYLLVHFLFNLS
jgi:hypothetical protein